MTTLKLIKGGKIEREKQVMQVSIPVKYTYNPASDEPHIYECIGLTARGLTREMAMLEIECAVTEVLSE